MALNLLTRGSVALAELAKANLTPDEGTKVFLAITGWEPVSGQIDDLFIRDFIASLQAKRPIGKIKTNILPGVAFEQLAKPEIAQLVAKAGFSVETIRRHVAEFAITETGYDVEHYLNSNNSGAIRDYLAANRADFQGIGTPPPTQAEPLPPGEKKVYSVTTSLNIQNAISNLGTLKQQAAAALTDYFNNIRANTEVNLRLASSFKDETGKQYFSDAKQVIVGTLSNGQPKLKTIVPKYAILDIYDVKNGKRGSKVAQTFIGIVDSLALKPTTQDLDNIENEL